MKKALKAFFIVTFSFLIVNPGFCFDAKKLNPFKKKQPPQKPKMVETKQEWEVQAQDIPLTERKLDPPEMPKSTKKYHMPEPHYVFEKYNYPQGKRELNVEDIKKNLFNYPYIVADINCRYVAYVRYYFSPDINQISSNFYVEKLDTSKTKTKRILEYNHKQQERIPIIEAGTKEYYPNLFSGLTLVDWSHDSKKLLIKERIGSLNGGIYKTYLYVHFMKNDIENSYTIKLLNFDNAIKNYFLDWENKQIIKYRYDIEPLGFSAENDNIIIAHCYVLDKENNKIFLGTWGYNLLNDETILMSKTDPIVNLSVNGLILKQTIE